MADEAACKETENTTDEIQLTATQKKNKKKREAAKKKKQEQLQNESNSTGQEESQVMQEQKTTQEKFEEELTWCIEQMEIGLLRQKPDKRTAAKTEQLVKSLKSPKTAMPKKRQIMNSVFGDYRQKMAEDAKSSNEKAKKPAKAYSVPKDQQKSMFLKISQTSKDRTGKALMEEDTNKESSVDAAWSFQPSQSTFKFNFDDPT